MRWLKDTPKFQIQIKLSENDSLLKGGMNHPHDAKILEIGSPLQLGNPLQSPRAGDCHFYLRHLLAAGHLTLSPHSR